VKRKDTKPTGEDPRGVAIPKVGDIRPNVPIASAVTADVRYLGTLKANAWRCKQQALQLAEVKRLADLRRQFPREIAPELYDGSYTTPEKEAEEAALAREIVIEGVVRVSGLKVGERELASVSDPEAIADLLQSSGLLPLVAVAVVSNQTPHAHQVF
jgi:hypothetical protein